jgi:hypothetical protein
MKMSERVKHGLYPINLIHYITEDELHDQIIKHIQLSLLPASRMRMDDTDENVKNFTTCMIIMKIKV